MDTSRIEQIPVVKAIGIQALHLHQAIYQRTDGRIGHHVFGCRACCCAPPEPRRGRPHEWAGVRPGRG